jgi:hypothetical protein
MNGGRRAVDDGAQIGAGRQHAERSATLVAKA